MLSAATLALALSPWQWLRIADPVIWTVEGHAAAMALQAVLAIRERNRTNRDVSRMYCSPATRIDGLGDRQLGLPHCALRLCIRPGRRRGGRSRQCDPDDPGCARRTLTGSLADRFDRRRVMISADVVRAALMVGAAVTIWLDGAPAVVYCIVGLSTITSTVFLPAEAALLPSLVRSPGELTAANVAQSTVIATAEFAGPCGRRTPPRRDEHPGGVHGQRCIVSLVCGARDGDPGRGSPAETHSRPSPRRSTVATALRRGDGRGAGDLLESRAPPSHGPLHGSDACRGGAPSARRRRRIRPARDRRRRDRLPQRRDRSGGACRRLRRTRPGHQEPAGVGFRCRSGIVRRCRSC